MITKELEATKKCCLYASDFHLEMILVPYIKERLDKTKFVILTENNLQETVKILLDRMNINKEIKKQIKKINWNTDDHRKLNIIKKDIENNKEIEIIISGSYGYVKKMNEYLEDMSKTSNINTIDCFCIEDTQVNLKTLKGQYEHFLNTSSLS